MINKKFREQIANEIEDTIILDNPSFDNSIIGFTDGGNLVYDYNRMVSEFAEENGVTEFEAIEFLDYNTIRASPYMGDERPMIIYRFEEYAE